MNENLKYAPGKPGFGSKGSDGSAGTQGLSMYFTDYDPISDVISINVAITNNTILWRSYTSEPLPDNRVYVTGDLFVDNEGKIYEINAETNTFVYKFASISTAGYFTSAQIATDNNYNRYYNITSSPKYIIDNVYANGAIAYYTIPTDIYNIDPKNYARIEYSNVVQGSYNPFTLYSSGETVGTDDNKAIALVRETATNTFRLGNLDDVGNIRNVNLAFDVLSLRHTKRPENYFTNNTEAGSILTNYEINANALFEGNFQNNPWTFGAGYTESEVSIYWNLTHFTTDTNVKSDLYFFKNVSTNGQTYAIDASVLKPLVFHDCSTTGSVKITGLDTLQAYKYYMNFYKNGWSRRSEVKTVTTSQIPNITVIPTISYEPSAAHTAGFCVSSNVPWTASIYSNPSTFMSNLSIMGTAAVDSSLKVDVSINSTYRSRTGVIRVQSTIGGDTPKTATVIQSGLPPIVYLDVIYKTVTDQDGSIGITKRGTTSASDLPSGTTISIDVYTTVYFKNNTAAAYTWNFELRDLSNNLITSGSRLVNKNETGYETLITSTIIPVTAVNLPVLIGTISTDVAYPDSTWYTVADITIYGNYESGDALTSILYNDNKLTISLPSEGVYTPPEI